MCLFGGWVLYQCTFMRWLGCMSRLTSSCAQILLDTMASIARDLGLRFELQT